MPALYQPDAGILQPEACIQAHCNSAQGLVRAPSLLLLLLLLLQCLLDAFLKRLHGFLKCLHAFWKHLLGSLKCLHGFY